MSAIAPRSAQLRTPFGARAKRIEDVKSKGHIAFKGDVEFFDVGGEVYVAPRHLGIFDLRHGTRHGRWESSRPHFERHRKEVYGV